MNIHRIVNSVFTSATYIVHEEGVREAFIVDCGDIQPIVEYLTAHNIRLAGIFITHSHFDHIYGLSAITTQYPDALVYTSKNGVEGLKNPKLNISKYHIEANDVVFESSMVRALADGESVNCAGFEVKAILTPGHDWSCISFICDKYLFTGDSYIPGIKVITKWPKSNKEDAAVSLEVLKGYEEQGYIIVPGHKA